MTNTNGNSSIYLPPKLYVLSIGQMFCKNGANTFLPSPLMYYTQYILKYYVYFKLFIHEFSQLKLIHVMIYFFLHS